MLFTKSAISFSSFADWLIAVTNALPIMAPLEKLQAFIKVDWSDIPKPINRGFFNFIF